MKINIYFVYLPNCNLFEIIGCNWNRLKFTRWKSPIWFHMDEMSFLLRTWTGHSQFIIYSFFKFLNRLLDSRIRTMQFKIWFICHRQQFFHVPLYFRWTALFIIHMRINSYVTFYENIENIYVQKYQKTY